MSTSRSVPSADPIVLIVDDDADARGMYGAFFRSKGWGVYTAADGRIAIDKATEVKPDAIVLDIAMPRVDGWTVLESLKQSSWTSPIRIVVLSAIADVRDEAMRRGADGYVAKPCVPDVLWLQVRALVKPREQSAAL